MTKTSLFIVIVPSYYIQTTHLKGFPKIKKWKRPKKHFYKKNQKTEKIQNENNVETSICVYLLKTLFNLCLILKFSVNNF